jgi:hypothetical protein
MDGPSTGAHPSRTCDTVALLPVMPAASHQVLVVADASLRLKGGSGGTGLQNGLPPNGAFVESVAVLRVGPCHGTGSDLRGRGSSNRSEEHEGHERVNHLIGEMHSAG